MIYISQKPVENKSSFLFYMYLFQKITHNWSNMLLTFILDIMHKYMIKPEFATWVCESPPSIWGTSF